MTIPKKKNHLILALLISVVCFLTTECGVRFYFDHHIIYDIEMSKYSMALKQTDADYRIGHRHRPNAKARLMGVDVSTNSHGFRGSDFPIARNEKKRIMFLGDSLTLGWGVEEEDTFASLLQSQLTKIFPTEVINMGTGNYNTEQETYLFLREGLPYQPDKVVVFYFINDVEPTPKISKLWFLGYSQLITFYWSRFHIISQRWNPNKDFKSYYSSLYEKDSPGLANMKSAFLTLKSVCQERNIDLQVVLLPEMHQLKSYTFQEEHAYVIDFLNKEGIDNMDLTDHLASRTQIPMDLWVARDDAHPNKRAHRHIAEGTLDFIKRNLYQ